MHLLIILKRGWSIALNKPKDFLPADLTLLDLELEDIVPQSLFILLPVAQVLFTETFPYVEKNDSFHLQFMDRTGSELLPALYEPVESSTDYETHPNTDIEGFRANSIPKSGPLCFFIR